MGVLYQEWLLEWDVKLREEERKILLLQDNFLGHVMPNTLTNIHVENFEPNLTVHIQPNDEGIICCFKAHYCAKFIQRAIDLYESGTTPSKIYDINQFEAMHLADEAWHEVDTTTIRNFWCKAGTLPNSDLPPIQPPVPISSLIHITPNPAPCNDPTAEAKKFILNILDDLVSTGALQPAN
ncbi:hypothetical protein PAXRUDRAFT_16247 [Paxillus rubicundulus Ve08.2h10]|uniref:DDE-1 domain-containing protein n=1 Tax=Paxillus rubicundulus Ve08.2h10 TaxID=930991 RepID=A0A0D0DMF3_9AGAM|nr:hypothetical protein PAXRUDRAFT_16247 [Paxillus rubicundulus Ve08.2h10]